MFFLFSKYLVFVLSPIVWIVVLLFFSFLSKYPDRKKRSLRFALILTFFFSNPFLFDECSRLWEIPAIRIEDMKSFDVGIVFGGMSVYDGDFDRAQFFRGVDRLIQTIELYKRGVIKKIIFTGGSGRVLHPEMKEGNYINRYMLYMGVPQKDFIIESESKNTFENALFTKAILEGKNIKGNFLLITSANHMRRSLSCFIKAGIIAEPYSTDRYAGPRKYEFDHLFIPGPSVMYDWDKLIHEMAGFIAYKIVGYI